MPRAKQSNKEMGLFFKRARQEQKLTYEELAEKAGISSRYLKEIENKGKVPSFEKIQQLVRALKVSPTPLFYKDNHADNLDYKRLEAYLTQCSEDQIATILAIVEAYLRTYKNPS
ncbi:MAG: helix-turn-helix domain-containing protein [Lachnospiraceae bacterium]|nr:helix-turn-helix domain-containing protein [Lachnospiraceae bacterium]